MQRLKNENILAGFFKYTADNASEGVRQYTEKESATMLDSKCYGKNHYGRPWPAVCINFVLKLHQIQVLTEPLCRAQASFYALPNNERGTKYRGLT